MNYTRTFSAIIVVGLSLALLEIVQPSAAQAGSHGGSRPSTGIIFEPTISFIRQNLRLVTHYVALMRSIFVGSYERPLVTSTDGPTTVSRAPPVKISPMDLPRSMAAFQ